MEDDRRSRLESLNSKTRTYLKWASSLAAIACLVVGAVVVSVTWDMASQPEGGNWDLRPTIQLVGAIASGVLFFLALGLLALAIDDPD